jgi:hypothetical protein
MAKTAEEARANLLNVLPHIRHAIDVAKAKGTAKLGILCEFPDGGGKVEARFEIEFLEDLAVAIGAPEQTEEDNQTAAARRLSDMIMGGSDGKG